MQRSVRAYFIAIAAVIAAVGLRWLLDPFLGDSFPLVTLFGAVACAVWVGGYLPATVTAVMGWLACAYLFVEPRGELGLDQAVHVVGLLAYAFTCALIIAIGQATHSAQARVLSDTGEQLKAEQDKLRALQSSRFLAAIVESSEDAIISKSLAGVIQSWNAAAERLFGFPAEHAIGRHISLVIPPERIQEEERIITSLRAGQRIDHFETERRHRDGRLIPVSLTISPIYDDDAQVIGASKIVRDITARRQVEIERDRFSRELAEADSRKNEFIATLAHELRNPLAPLANMLEVLKRADGEPATRRQARETMERQLRQLVRLVDDLLDLNRISHNRLDLRAKDEELAPIVHQAVESSRPLAEGAGQTISVDLPHEPIYLHADAARLAQVLGNLLNNASRYSPAGAHIGITARREGTEIILAVRDTGIGIAPEKLQEVFEMFVQLDRRNERAQGGLGIGLTLARRLVNMHGGSIEARSAGPGKGSEFVVRLPMIELAARAPVVKSMPPAFSSRRVLVVDDNEDAAHSLAMMLDLAGNETRTAHDGEAALEAAFEYRPDVMLLDIGLPRMSGLEVCRRIRLQPWGRKLKVIALTGWGQEQDRRRSKEAGFDGHLVKPVDPETLTEVMASIGGELASP